MNKINFIILVLSVFIGLSACIGIKEIHSKNFFSGYIYDSKKAEINLKYIIEFDSLDIMRFRIYSISGLKYTDFIVKPDTFIIKYILDNSYRDILYNTYYKLNKEVCLYYVFYDLFKGKLFANGENRICYNKTFVDKDYINLSSIIYSQVLTMKGSKFKTVNNLKIPAFIEINFQKKDYTLTILK